MKHLYLMRHGETLFNLQKKIQGWCDSPLTENGIHQAQQAGKLLKDISFDHYYSSTSERCCDTLEAAVGQVPYKRLKGLKERNFGSFEGEHEYLNPPWNQNDFNYDDIFPHYGGETSQQVMDRMYHTINNLMSQEDHHTVLCVSHAGSGFAFFRQFEDGEILRGNGGFKNCNILHFTYENGQFKFIELLKI